MALVAMATVEKTLYYGAHITLLCITVFSTHIAIATVNADTSPEEVLVINLLYQFLLGFLLILFMAME